MATTQSRKREAHDPGHLLTAEEAAAKLNVPKRWVLRAIAQRRIKKTKVGKYVRIHPDDLAAFIAEARGGER